MKKKSLNKERGKEGGNKIIYIYYFSNSATIVLKYAIYCSQLLKSISNNNPINGQYRHV